jgi:hypothetical protein
VEQNQVRASPAGDLFSLFAAKDTRVILSWNATRQRGKFQVYDVNLAPVAAP